MNKLMTTVTLSAGLLLITACGVSPSDPSDLPTLGAQASAPALSSPASMATTSAKGPGQIEPPAPCGMSQELQLQLGSRGRGYVEVDSNYQRTERGCSPLEWQLEPGGASRDLSSESFSASSGEGLRVFHGGSSLRGAWVSATSPDGQVATLYVRLDDGAASDETN